MTNVIPEKQYAVQLTGPDTLELNTDKEVHSVGPTQILGKVETVGLCFSDLKLLKQFDQHARKGLIQAGIEPEALKEIPSYVPDKTPTVPGHEATVRIVAMGDQVTGIGIGERYLVQTDYRWLPTANSNSAFGYNFEGGLQQYVLMDQRVITSPEGDSMLLPASEELSASSVALVEPWACVEEAYVVKERTSLTEGGQMLVVADDPVQEAEFVAFLGRYGRPGKITLVSKREPISAGMIPIEQAKDLTELTDGGFDDVVYYGSNTDTVELLFHKVANNGLLIVVQCGGKFGRDVEAAVGRVHYGNIRIVGTLGFDPAEAMTCIPSSGEIRIGNKINVIGAGGPMGVMHVIRNICQGVPQVEIWAGDLDNQRLELLSRVAAPLAKERGVEYYTYNPKEGDMKIAFDYTALMAPVPQLVARAIKDSATHGIINIFAGIPAHVTGKIDLDLYIEKQLYFVGTSGSVLDDMKIVLGKVESGNLNTDLSVAAISGMAGAVEGIRAVENHSIPGKILVYPDCPDMGLIRLDAIDKTMPEIAACLENGFWTKKAEKMLLDKHGKKDQVM